MRQMEKDEEKKLIGKAKEGDMEAFEELIRKYEKNIYFLCRRMIGVHQSADDISQETFIKAYLSLHTFKDGMNFYSWIRKIAMNNSLNYLKAHKKEEPWRDRENTISKSNSSFHQELPQEKLQRTQIEQKFEEALRALPPDQRSVFILRTLDSLSYKEISHALNIPYGTVMSRLARARKKLKALLSQYL